EENGTIPGERRPSADSGAAEKEGARMPRVDAQPLHVDGHSRRSAVPGRRCARHHARERPGHGAQKDKGTKSHGISTTGQVPGSETSGSLAAFALEGEIVA